MHRKVRWITETAVMLALLVLGGQFAFSAVKKLWKEIVSGTLGRIILAPLVGIGFANLMFQKNLIKKIIGFSIMDCAIFLFLAFLFVALAIIGIKIEFCYCPGILCKEAGTERCDHGDRSRSVGNCPFYGMCLSGNGLSGIYG